MAINANVSWLLSTLNSRKSLEIKVRLKFVKLKYVIRIFVNLIILPTLIPSILFVVLNFSLYFLSYFDFFFFFCRKCHQGTSSTSLSLDLSLRDKFSLNLFERVASTGPLWQSQIKWSKLSDLMVFIGWLE